MSFSFESEAAAIRRHVRMLPEHMREGMASYIIEGIPVGNFLTAVLCNDFMTAAERADEVNKRALFDYIYFLKCYAPAGCHSSHSNFTEWCRVGGLRGLLQGGAADAAPVGASAPGLREDVSAGIPVTDDEE